MSTVSYATCLAVVTATHVHRQLHGRVRGHLTLAPRGARRTRASTAWWTRQGGANSLRGRRGDRRGAPKGAEMEAASRRARGAFLGVGPNINHTAIRRFPAPARWTRRTRSATRSFVRPLFPQGFRGTRQGDLRRRGAVVAAEVSGVAERGPAAGGGVGSVVGTNKRLHDRTTGSAAFPGRRRDGKRQERTQESRRVRPRVLPLRLRGGYSVLLALRPSMVLLSQSHEHEREAGECVPAG